MMESHIRALRLKHLSSNESSGNYCSLAALQGSRCQHIRDKCTNVQKETLSYQLSWPPVAGRQQACRAFQIRKGLGLPLISRGSFTLREWLYLFPSCAALFDGYSEQKPHSWSFQRHRVLVLISDSDFIGLFCFLFRTHEAASPSLTVHGNWQDQALN